MPSRFLIRDLKENSYYHIYNKGKENQKIFFDQADYEKFLYYLYIYTASPAEIAEKYPDLPKRLKTKNLSNEIFLVSFCLLPDHFHILLKQVTNDATPFLMKQVINGYTTYFNDRYKKKGAVFWGRYKSVHIESEYILVQLVRFVHLNPLLLGIVKNIKEYQWSSFTSSIFHTGIINRFDSVEEWENFNTNIDDYTENLTKIEKLTIDT